jgi:class 3 adenylate cyclase
LSENFSLPEAEELAGLAEYIRSLGASEEELASAAQRGRAWFAPLALDLILRPEGELRSVGEFLSTCGIEERLARRLWLAFGLPETTEFPFAVTSDLAAALVFLAGFVDTVGEDAVVGFARVLGACAARMAEALSDATRVGFEIPQRSAGVDAVELIRTTTELAAQRLPTFFDCVAAVLRRHLVAVSYQSWRTDQRGAAVTLERCVGFADLVGSSDALRLLDPGQIAALVDRFEQQAWDLVTGAGGRVVKLIGDAVMFVHDQPEAACRIASDLVRVSPQPIRVGLAYGSVVALHGDYYGPTVILAARLVQAAPPSEVVVSESVTAAAPRTPSLPIELGPLKGFLDPLRTFRLLTAER